MPRPLAQLREDTEARAKELAATLIALEAAVTAKDLDRSRATLRDARRRERDLEPVTRIMAAVATSQIGAWEIDSERDEASRFAGLRAVHLALSSTPPSWEDAAKSAALVRRGGELLGPELGFQTWSLRRMGQAISDGIYALGARSDDSDWPDLKDRSEDLRAEIGGVLRAVSAIEDAVRLREPAWADPLEALLGALHDTLRTMGDEPHGMLDFLRLTGELGREVRRAMRRLGAPRIAPPFLALRPDADADLTPVSMATFPRLSRVHHDPRLSIVGAALFRSPLLSRTNDIGCVSCHDPARNFSRETPRLTFDRKVPPRNAPGLWNVGEEVSYFWDGRATTLEAQVEIAVGKDMGGNWDDIAERVGKDSEIGPALTEITGAKPTPASIRAAIVAFEETLLRDDTPFDDYVRGNLRALDERQKDGFDLYFGKARCSRCHRLPLTSGVIPPRFLRTEPSSIGVTVSPTSHVLDSDPGRAAVTHRPLDEGLFKVPTVRGLDRTAPYFHNGAFRTLDEVLEFYVKGGGPGLGLTVQNPDPDLAPVPLDAKERAALLAFLRDGLRYPAATETEPTAR